MKLKTCRRGQAQRLGSRSHPLEEGTYGRLAAPQVRPKVKAVFIARSAPFTKRPARPAGAV